MELGNELSPVYVSDSWGCQLHDDLETRQCSPNCDCRRSDTGKHTFHAYSLPDTIHVRILDSELSSVLYEHLRIPYIATDAGQKIFDGFELLRNHFRVREHLVDWSYVASAECIESSTFSKLQLLVEGFLEDYAVWSRYGIGELWRRHIIDDNLRSKFTNERVVRGISALDDGFKCADSVLVNAPTESNDDLDIGLEDLNPPVVDFFAGVPNSDVLLPELLTPSPPWDPPNQNARGSINNDWYDSVLSYPWGWPTPAESPHSAPSVPSEPWCFTSYDSDPSGQLPLGDAAANPCDDGTLLLGAIQSKDAREVSRLLDKVADVNCFISVPGGYTTPLIASIQVLSDDFVNLVIERGADINLRVEMKDGNHAHSFTALHAAVDLGCLPIVKILLSHGADLSALWKLRGEHAFSEASALNVAQKNHHQDIFELILTWNTSFAPNYKKINFVDDSNLSEKASKARKLLRATAEGKIDAIIQLLRTGADINAISFNGTALSVASQSKKQHVINALLRRGASASLASLYLGRSGHTDVAESLVKFAYGKRVGFQNLRARFIRQYKRLVRISHSSRTKLGNVTEKFPSYRRVWSTGIAVAQNICKGETPSNVLDTVALLAIARAIAETLAGDKGEIDFIDQFESDLVRWQQLFLDEDSLGSYREAARLLWGVEITEHLIHDDDSNNDHVLEQFKELISTLLDKAHDGLGLYTAPVDGDDDASLRLDISIARFKQRRLVQHDLALLSIGRRACSPRLPIVSASVALPTPSSGFQPSSPPRAPKNSLREPVLKDPVPDPMLQDISQHLTQDVIHEYTAWMRRAVEYLIRGAIFAIVFYFLCRMSSQSTIEAVEKANGVNLSSMRYRLLTLRAFLGIGDMCIQHASPETYQPRKRKCKLTPKATSPDQVTAPRHWYQDLQSWKGKWM
ncbi:putative multiple ankyrin repeats single kh domain protein [Ilyonectria robusta]